MFDGIMLAFSFVLAGDSLVVSTVLGETLDASVILEETSFASVGGTTGRSLDTSAS